MLRRSSTVGDLITSADSSSDSDKAEAENHGIVNWLKSIDWSIFSIYAMRTDIFINGTTKYQTKTGFFATLFIGVVTIFIMCFKWTQLGELQ